MQLEHVRVQLAFPAGKLVWGVSVGLGEGHLMLFWLFPDSGRAGYEEGLSFPDSLPPLSFTNTYMHMHKLLSC